MGILHGVMGILHGAMGILLVFSSLRNRASHFFEIDTHAQICFTLSIRRYPVKTLLALSILFSTIAWLPVHAELTETDLEKIRQIFREEFREELREELEKPIIDPIDASFGEIDARFDSINRNLDRIQILLWIATVLVVVAGIVNWTYVFKSWRSQ